MGTILLLIESSAHHDQLSDGLERHILFALLRDNNFVRVRVSYYVSCTRHDSQVAAAWQWTGQDVWQCELLLLEKEMILIYLQRRQCGAFELIFCLL